ncbi:DUF294 nucleotidyltransferase-like domain-containing protein [Calidifontibacillus oryziterrae]|uniref:DUF294 nucleotidyltransferase-like domain-containing protein n=1 Tax=Calidifontibacillus oryziterrae TaxID=1191699 RepID=UPI0003819F18|nr:DUF294 nucleotidyltransferase-like domain-containing protein [Calidifontibacillus oryziterrae]
MKVAKQRLDKQQVYEQIKGHPFFKGVPLHEEKQLFELCEIKEYAQTELIYQANQRRDGLLLLLEGSAEVYIYDEEHDRIEALEVIQKGELIGFPTLANFLGVSKSNKYEEMVRVRALESCYGVLIPFGVIQERWEDEGVRDYLLQQTAMRLKDIYMSLAEQVKITRQLSESNHFVVRLQDIMVPAVSVTKEATVQEVSTLMAQNKIDSIVILEEEKLVGIITKTDLVNRVLAKSKPYDLRVEYVMTKNPSTISRLEYYYAALTTMLLQGFKHLPVVHEETNEVVGIVSLGDLLRKKNENTVRTLRRIEQIDEENLPSIKEAIYLVLETLIQDKVPATHILEVITALYDRLAVRCVQLAVDSLRVNKGLTPPVDFCWYTMGSSGRGEQFMMTDQDHFLVYEDSEAGQRERTDEYFALLGEEIVIYMERAGYARCIGHMMSNNPIWRGSLKTWETRQRQWMLQATNDNILLAQNFFSFRYLYGSLRLNEKFENQIAQQLERAKIFLYRMASEEKERTIPNLDHPIRSLFRLDRKHIDIKKEILFPFHHSLQILTLSHLIVAGTPEERIDFLVRKGIITENFATDLKTAFEQVMMIYIKQKWGGYKRGEKASSKLTFTHLTTREKEELILTLKTFRELQSQMLGEFSI